ncbi:hypothetical protein [Psychrobacillus sp. FSL H8-0487]|uniref:hypothetical protein n=1 Tax=Psychrobacillus sp. FSL H8-0487 TaxID=2921391 RepID=UPI0030FB9A15
MILNSINNLERIYVEHDETYLYFNKAMNQKNVLIREHLLEEDNFKFQTMIEINHFNLEDSYRFIMYWGEMLTPIQKYRIVKDIAELFEENTLINFKKIAREMSVSYSAELMQSDNLRAKVRASNLKPFEELKNHNKSK